MTQITLYNTASRTVEPFRPIKAGHIGMYACGPTVYHYAHIGNMRAYVTQDILRRALLQAGYNLTHVMNITDVGHLQSDADEGEDKMMLAAAREKRSVWDIARYYEDTFHDHSKKLNIQKPDIICRATDHIAEMIAMVEKIIQHGHAYVSGGNVYFDVGSFDKYTEFANLALEQGKQTDRVDNDPLKRNQNDFVLWFSESKYPNQVMKWPSPWGVGFPGWHIECSAMATKYLGDHFDIHCGGIDHVRVHHTNEIAQSECAHGKHPWVNYWIHNDFLNILDEKMSKSKGNITTVDTLIERGFDPLSFRYLLLTSHYRKPAQFDWDTLTQAQSALKGLRSRVQTLKENEGKDVPTLSQTAMSQKAKFWESIYNDLSTPIAVAVLHETLKHDGLTDSEKLALARDFDTLFGLDIEREESLVIEPAIQSIIEARDNARKSKDWANADALKQQLIALGYDVQDTPNGTKIKLAK